jgi:hypothetical protein
MVGVRQQLTDYETFNKTTRNLGGMSCCHRPRRRTPDSDTRSLSLPRSHNYQPRLGQCSHKDLCDMDLPCFYLYIFFYLNLCIRSTTDPWNICNYYQNLPSTQELESSSHVDMCSQRHSKSESCMFTQLSTTARAMF